MKRHISWRYGILSAIGVTLIISGWNPGVQAQSGLLNQPEEPIRLTEPLNDRYLPGVPPPAFTVLGQHYGVPTPILDPGLDPNIVPREERFGVTLVSWPIDGNLEFFPQFDGVFDGNRIEEEPALIKSVTAPVTIGPVSVERFEEQTNLTVLRVDRGPKRGLNLSKETQFYPDERLAITPVGTLQLVYPLPSGEVAPHPRYRAVARHPYLLLVKRSIPLANVEAALNPETEAKRIGQLEPQTLMEQPLSKAMNATAPTRSQPYGLWYDTTSKDAVPVEVPVSQTQQDELPEIPVNYPATLPTGWRTMTINNVIFIVDEHGVIQDILPASVAPWHENGSNAD